MARVSQLIVQVVNAEPDGSNWGVGRGIGTTTPVPSGGSGDCICDRSGGRPGDRPVDGGGGTVTCCWASALPDSNANPSAAVADNPITMKASRIDIAIPNSPHTIYHSGNGAELVPLGMAYLGCTYNSTRIDLTICATIINRIGANW